MKRRAIIVPVIVLALLAVGVTLYRNHLNEQRRLYSPGGSYRCSSNLQKIGIALLLYETGHQGRYPMRLEELLTPDGLHGHVEWMTPAELRDRLASPQTTRGTSSTAPTTSQSPGS
jgi:hypothetical protein